MLNVVPIPALHDNYIWMMMHPESDCVLIVDPGEATPVIEKLKQENLKLAGILITHHHWDHTAGIKDLLAYQTTPVIGPPKVPYVTQAVSRTETIRFKKLHCEFKILEIPGHTLDHIAFVGENVVFCGDTLFTGGCGRVFEGTPAQMLASLDQLAKLPENTEIYCGHEYTEANLKFAAMVEPRNSDLLHRINAAKMCRSKNLPTVPSTISLELKTNPFLRCEEPTVQAAATEHAGKLLSEPVDVFAEIRKWKDCTI